MEKTKTSKDKDWTQRAQVQVLKLDRKEMYIFFKWLCCRVQAKTKTLDSRL